MLARRYSYLAQAYETAVSLAHRRGPHVDFQGYWNGTNEAGVRNSSVIHFSRYIILFKVQMLEFIFVFDVQGKLKTVNGIILHYLIRIYVLKAFELFIIFVEVFKYIVMYAYSV